MEMEKNIMKFINAIRILLCMLLVAVLGLFVLGEQLFPTWYGSLISGGSPSVQTETLPDLDD